MARKPLQSDKAPRAAADAERKSQRRDAILDAAARAFFAKGVEGTTTLDIASAAGISKRDLYAHFSSKTEMLEALVTSRVERMVAPVDLGEPQSRPQVIASLDAFGRQFLAFLLSCEPMSLYRLAIAADQQADAGRALLTKGIEATTQRIAVFVDAAARAGHLRIPQSDLDPAVQVYFSTLIGGLQMHLLLDPSHVVATAVIEDHASLALRMLLTFET